MITYAQFILDLPAFANAAAYPQSSFNLYQQFASLMLTPPWGQPSATADPTTYTMYDFGMELIIAHYLDLDGQSNKRAATGGSPGQSSGPISSKAVGPVNISYDTAIAALEDAGQWGLTTYGTRFLQMARLIGAGPTQVTPGYPGIANNGPAWYGPSPWPGYFG